jgi:spermidine/putrescine-binding protein
MTISLMNALLTGLNENNEELAKRIFALCEKISKKYGYIWIDGAVWVNILKSSKVKIAGFKYFMKVFKDRDK